MMVVTGLLPVIGVPLPFISSGGSALLASMAALGVLLSFARREPGAQEAITARVGAVRRTISVLPAPRDRSEEHTSELQSRGHLVCRLLLEKKKKETVRTRII